MDAVDGGGGEAGTLVGTGADTPTILQSMVEFPQVSRSNLRQFFLSQIFLFLLPDAK